MSYQNTVNEQAALELFAKQASAEGIDLEQLDDAQVEAAFEHFVENILPEMLGESSVEDKIASAQNAIAFDAFVKAASAEGVDLNDFSEDDVAELFGAWLVQDVPQLFEEQAKEAELVEYAKIAQANLSEMTVMGQHLGEVAADAFLHKIAAPKPDKSFRRVDPMRRYGKGTLALPKENDMHGPVDPGSFGRFTLNARKTLGDAGQRYADLLMARNVRADVARNMAAKGVGGFSAYSDLLGGGMATSSPLARTEALKSLGTQAGTLGAAGLGAYGAYRGIKALRDRKRGEKSASAVDERVLEILAAHGLIG